MARTTPAQKPRGWARITRIFLPSCRRRRLCVAGPSGRTLYRHDRNAAKLFSRIGGTEINPFGFGVGTPAAAPPLRTDQIVASWGLRLDQAGFRGPSQP